MLIPDASDVYHNSSSLTASPSLAAGRHQEFVSGSVQDFSTLMRRSLTLKVKERRPLSNTLSNKWSKWQLWAKLHRE